MIPSGELTILIDDITNVLRSVDPLLLSLALLVIAGIGLGGWWLFRWMRRPPGVRLKRILGKEDAITVLMHPNPDPDAMACAMGVKAIADAVNTEVALQFPGEIRHQENRAFRTVLDLDLEQIDSASDLTYDTVVLVDHNTARGFTGAQKIEPIAVIDHHPGNGAGTAFTDVRTEYGAASSIVTEYMLEITDNGDDSHILSPNLATGLLYGIQSDTNHLTKGCSAAEFTASAELFPHIDEDLLNRIANPQVSNDVLEIKATAITEKEVRGPFAVCDVGTLSNVDAIPQAADELMHLEGVTAVVVFGEKNNTLHLSGRSRDDRVHMGETLRRAVNDIPMASAGGHARMGGGQVSVDHMNGIGPSEGLSRAEFQDRLFSSLAGERE